MMKKTKDQLFGEKQKGNRLSFFVKGYVNLIVNGIVLLLCLGVPTYFLFVNVLGWSFFLWFPIYVFGVYLATPLMNRFRIGDYLIGKFEKWIEKIEKETK